MNATEVDELLATAEDMPYGPPRTERCEEAVRIADSLNDDGLAYDARIALIEAAVFGGAPQKAIVAFAWCVAKSDANPERFPERGGWGTDLLWMHKWVAGQVHAYPQITRAQVTSALDDMETRYTRHGLSLRPVHQLRMHAALEMDEDTEVAHGHFRKWQWAKRDSYADCAACETHSAVEFHIKRGQHERAFDTARPLLEGRQACAEVPHHTYAVLLRPGRVLGRDDLDHLHRVGLPMVRSNPDFLEHLAHHVDHLVLTKRLDDAAPLVTTVLEWTRATQDFDSRMWGFATAKLFFSKGGQTRLPTHLAAAEAEPVAYFDREAKAIAAQFDTRNGNTLISQRLATRHD